ncbi:hypothetical protein OHA72_59020 [Dactylosporangium sp. NBC_01737]|uniref:hypothetical protein n=1 Tax=Dactylosporangium sp. NBC_01737 TaxID=2975959 RepID=UPI002E1393FD|nr:hypothetical protein OHA72_59020 [Dactylosporangium sp. NBC_01737]
MRVGDAGQLPPAGDDRRAPRAARQQRGDVRGVAGVVEQDQHRPVGDGGAEPCGELLGAAPPLVLGHAERGQEPAEDGLGRDRLRGRAAQGREQLPVGEPGPQRVRGTEREDVLPVPGRRRG